MTNRPTLASFRTELFAGGGCWLVFSQAGLPDDCIPAEIADLVLEAGRLAPVLAALFERIEQACGYDNEED